MTMGHPTHPLLAYVSLLLPYSVTRVLVLYGFHVPSAVVMFAFTCWYMLGKFLFSS